MATTNSSQWFNPAPDRLEAGGVGIVFPRLSTAQRTALTLGTGDAGLFTYDTQLNQLFAWNGSFSAQMAALNSAGGLSVVSPIVVATGIITTNNPGFQLTEQWNNAGVTFTGWFTNITDTSSAVGSLFADFQLSSVSSLRFFKTGAIGLGTNTVTITPDQGGVNRLSFGGSTGSGDIYFDFGGGTNIRLTSTYKFGWASANAVGSAMDTVLVRDAANVIAMKNGANVQEFRTYNAAGTGYKSLIGDGQIISLTGAAFTNNAAASVATITNSPTVGNPTKWIPINDNGTIRNIPAW
jgi:hypothetical protein